MTKRKNSRGFTLAEMLIVVAIIGILSGVAFVAVQDYQRSSTRLEFDGIAKEIFVAAQNHLTAAQSQGYLDNTEFGHAGDSEIDTENDIYFILGSDSYAIKNLMLPNYAVDSTVLGGSYIIRYQASSATVLDVFYSRPNRSTMLTLTGKTLEEGDYSPLMGTSPNYRKGGEENREKYGADRAVVGWYGGGEAVPRGERLRIPSFEVVNAERLFVNVTDPNYKTGETQYHTIKLIIVGQSSKAEKYYTLRDKSGLPNDERIIPNNDGAYLVILDDIMSDKNQHFGDIVADYNGNFIPGEDISIRLVAYSTENLANVAMSAEKSTNSIFADIVPYKAGEAIKGTDVKKHVAGIANFRHLENLDSNISSLGNNNLADPVSFTKAGQTNDFDWKTFIGDRSVYNSVNLAAASGCYVPVSSRNAVDTYAIAYDGQKHKIENLKVNYAGDSGLFGTFSNGCSVSNLELIDFEIKGTTSAGALIGTATGTTVTNVLAHNSIDETTKQEKLTKNIEAAGCAGGLVGKTVGSTTVQFSAASLIVNGTTVAGGLIGDAEGTINGCYSGGHTKNGSYEEWVSNGTDVTTDDKYDVTGGTVGGLVGTSSAAISNSYSTCSVSGTTAGGFAGSASDSITNCYATGLVSGTTKFAFVAGELPTGSTGNYYYMTVNEVPKAGGKPDETEPMSPYSGYRLTNDEAANAALMAKIKPIDLNAGTYNGFTGEWNSWNPASAYDSALVNYYSGKYTLKTVDELIGAVQTTPTDTPDAPTGYNNWNEIFVSTHYGDWPSPEVFFINTNS